MKWGTSIFLSLSLLGCSKSSPEKPQESNTRDSIQIWANTAKNNHALSLEERENLVIKAYKENSSLKDKNRRAKNLSRISLAYSNLGDSLNFRKTNTELITTAKEVGDKIAHGEAHWDLGDFFNRSKPDSAFYHYKEAYTLFTNAELGSKKTYPGRMLLAMANVRENNRDYIGAENDVIAAIDEFKKIDAKERLHSSYNQLGLLQGAMKKYDKALAYYDKASEYIKYTPEPNQAKYEMTLLNNVSFIYLAQQDFSKAFERYQDLKNMSIDNADMDLMNRMGYTSMAISGFKSGNLDTKQAISLIQKSNRALDSIGNTYQKARNKQLLAEILLAENQSTEALELTLEAKEIAEASGNNDRLLETLKFLSQIDEKNGAQYAKAYFDLNEQLQLQERTIQDKFARIQMETDEIIEENESLAKRTELLAGVALGLLVLGIGMFTIISQKISNQKLKFKQKQQENNQEIYNLMLAQHGKMEEGKKSEQKRVSEELHDGILGQMLGIRLVLSGLNERDDQAAIEQRAELIVKLQELEEEIRTISHELNASAYEKVHNFILSVQDLIATVEKSAKISINFEHTDNFEWDSLHSDIKINSYRIVQELLQNCVKHAQCENVQVAFLNHKNLLSLTVTDDGIGFDDSKAKKGIGLKNIISRVKNMGAQLEIKSEPSQGTKATITIPNIDLKKQHPKSKSERNTVLEA
jgi:signal transduction histidine kinase